MVKSIPTRVRLVHFSVGRMNILSTAGDFRGNQNSCEMMKHKFCLNMKNMSARYVSRLLSKTEAEKKVQVF